MGSVLILLATWAWNHTHKRIDDTTTSSNKRFDEVWKTMDEKAPLAELTRARDTQVEIFEQIRAHDAEDRNRHTELVGKIGRLEGMLDLVLQELRRPK